MIEVEKEEFYLLPLGSHHKEKSLSHIATEFYGKRYNALRALDRANNDTYEVYDLSTKDNCEEFIWEHYKPLDRWLKLNIGDDVSQSWERGPKIATYDFDIDDQAPDPSYVIADMILKGHLPYGQYLCEVSW